MPSKKTVLHVGCSVQRIVGLRGFDAASWHELRLDIDPSVQPDIIGSMTDMSAVAESSVDAIFSSHNIEHLYPHDVPIALGEFLRVLKPEGYLVVSCPDLQSVCARVAQGSLDEPAYYTGAGLPIAPLDILYGWRASMAQGNLYMAHRTGFTKETLVKALKESGFGRVAALQQAQRFALYAVATKHVCSAEEAIALAKRHVD